MLRIREELVRSPLREQLAGLNCLQADNRREHGMGAKDGLRWSGNIDAQRRADAAYGRLRDKPRKKGKSKKKRRGKSSAETRERTDWTGRYREYLQSRQWRAKKKIAYDYHGRKCHDCGAERGLEVHHKTYKRLGREKMKDLEILCGACHRIRHEGKPGVVTTDYLSEQFRAIIG